MPPGVGVSPIAAVLPEDQLQQDARWGSNEQTPFIELGQVHGRIMDIERVQLLAILRVAFQAKARVIDGLSGSIDARGTPRNQMHDWFVAGVKPIAWKRKGRPIANLQIENPFQKASGAFKIGRAQRDMIEVHGRTHAMVGVTPPSTRNTAPLVADERGLATYATRSAISSGSIMRWTREERR